jgi:hypothetical protein
MQALARQTFWMPLLTAKIGSGHGKQVVGYFTRPVVVWTRLGAAEGFLTEKIEF